MAFASRCSCTNVKRARHAKTFEHIYELYTVEAHVLENASSAGWS
jgi:hypothetical protein